MIYALPLLAMVWLICLAIWSHEQQNPERDRAERLVAELLKATADAKTAREAAARLDGELAASRSRPWWRRLVGWQ